MNHEELVKEAEKLAEDMDKDKMVECAFIFGYVANAELRAVLQELKHHKWILCSVLVVLVIGILANLLT